MSTVETPEAVVVCPKCKSQGSWGENSWCPECGYYPKFAGGEIPEPIVLQSAETEELEPTKTEVAAAAMPQWMKILFGGVLLIVAANVAVRVWVYFNGGQRAIFSLIEMLIGLGMFCGASVMAWKECKKSDKRMSIADVVTNPFNVWQPTLARMPATKNRVFCATWGLTMFLTAILILGGIRWSGLYTNDWGFKQPKKRNLLAEAIGSLKTNGPGSAEDLLEALDEYKQKIADGIPAEPPTVNGYVYGVLPDESLALGRILVAHRRGGILKHCAVLHGTAIQDSDNKKDYAILERIIAENIIAEPAVSSHLNATWVKPVIRLKLTYADIVGDGELVEPTFYALETQKQKKKPADKPSEEAAAQEDNQEDAQLTDDTQNQQNTTEIEEEQALLNQNKDQQTPADNKQP
jgi:hypothetical protein